MKERQSGPKVVWVDFVVMGWIMLDSKGQTEFEQRITEMKADETKQWQAIEGLMRSAHGLGAPLPPHCPCCSQPLLTPEEKDMVQRGL